MRISKTYTPNCSKKVFVIQNVKIIVPQTYLIKDLNSEEIVGRFCEKELKKIKEFRIEEVIKKNDDKLYVKWKGYVNSSNSWIDEKRYHYIK